MDLKIYCDSVNINTKYYDNSIELDITNINLSFLNGISEDDIVKNFDNNLLFDKLIENDEELLHSYLVSHGYIFNKN